MITRIIVNGFKSLDGFKLDLQPGLNILIGPNGSGKTNIVLFFEFLSYLVRGDLSEAVSRIGGAGSLFRRIGETEYQDKMSATIYGSYPSDEKGQFVCYRYAFEINLPKEIESVVFKSQSLALQFAKKFVVGEFIDQVSEKWDILIEQEVDAKLTPSVRVLTTNIKLLRMPYIFSELKRESSRIRRIEQILTQMSSVSETLLLALPRFTPMFQRVVEDVIRGESYNIVPSRVKLPEDSAKVPGIEKDGSGLSATLYAIKRNKAVPPREFPYRFFFHPARPQTSSATLRDLLKYVNLANTSISDIDVSNDPFNNQLKVTLVIKNGDYRAALPLSSMSDGTLKWLALIAAVLTASSIFSIEEPENYLHPLMQAQVLGIMRDILLRKRRYSFTLMTTHSETILNSSTPKELIVVSLSEGQTQARRCVNPDQLAKEIQRTGFGLGYYYLAGAVQDE